MLPQGQASHVANQGPNPFQDGAYIPPSGQNYSMGGVRTQQQQFIQSTVPSGIPTGVSAPAGAAA